MKRITVGLLFSFCFFLMVGVVLIEAEGFGASAEYKGAALRPHENLEVDVLIIGGGGGGLAAAAAAKGKLRDSGSVLILEKRSVTGGNSSNWTVPINAPGAGMGMPGVQEAEADPQSIADSQFKTIIDWNHWRVDALLVRRLTSVSQYNAEWLLGLLSEKEKEKFLEFLSVPGYRSIESWEPYSVFMTRLCRNLGVEIMTDTKGTKLLTDKSGDVIGALAEGKDKDYKISADAVIIATGGFIGNAELMKKFYHPYDDDFYDEVYIVGNMYTGDGILMAAEVGASVDATVSFESCMKSIPWEVSPGSLRRFIERGGEYIRVDARGLRFVDESASHSHNARHQLIGRIHYLVFDENIKEHIIDKQASGSAGGPMAGFPGGNAQSYDTIDDDIQKQIDKGYAIKANSIDELGKWIGCDPGVLKGTIRDYNGFCEKGYDEDLLKPAEYLVPLSKSPYYAIRNKLAILLTHGPLRVSTEMEVVDTDYNPIPGLYAAGADIGGTENDTYAHLSAHSSTWTMTSGRIAGENAVDYSRNRRK
jgi:succinate dehydrogenase/fumarate reductase flavoprotein subunit